MAKLLNGSINLSKVDKSKIVTGKTGDKFINISVWLNDTEDQYGNIAGIQQSTKKDEKKIYIGNLKEFKRVEEVQAETLPPASQTEQNDLPW
jgi:hypothetical protein